MAVDFDGDGKKEQIKLYSTGNAYDFYGDLTVGTADGNWMDLVGWMICDTSMW